MRTRVKKVSVLRKKQDINHRDYQTKRMEIINKTHEDISVNKTVNDEVFIKFHNEKEIYFSLQANRDFGLGNGLYAHFVNDDDLWFVYFNTDPDGFELFKQKGRNNVSIFNKALITLFLKRTRCSIPVRFPLKLIEVFKGSNQLIKIEINNPKSK